MIMREKAELSLPVQDITGSNTQGSQISICHHCYYINLLLLPFHLWCTT